MHRCLQAKDIFREILDKLPDVCRDDEYEHATRRATRQTLASLARTCHAFYGSTMDELWATLDDLSPLIKCMPCDLWQETRGVTRWNSTPTVFLTFRRKPCPEEWAPFLKHARRVKSIGILLGKTYYTTAPKTKTFDPPNAYRIDWDVMAAVNTYILNLDPDISVFPRLRHLDCSFTQIEPMMLACVPRLVGPLLSSLVLTSVHQRHAGMVGPMLHLSHLLGALKGTATTARVEGFALLYWCYASSILDVFPTNFISNIRTFEASNGYLHNCYDIRVLSAFPRLEVLKLIGQRPPVHPTAHCLCATPLPWPSFPCLRELHARNIAIAECSYILSHLSSPASLHTFCLDTLDGRYSFEETAIVMDKLSSCPSLRTIRLEGESRFDGRDIAKLFTLRHVQRFELTCSDSMDGGFTLRRLDVTALGRAWPELRSLHIGWAVWMAGEMDEYPSYLIDLKTLRALRDSCPRLESLVVNLNGVSPDHTDLLRELCASPPGDHPLKHLQIGPATAWHMQDGRAVAMILTLLFPQLPVPTNRDSEAHDPWRGVLELFPLVRDIIRLCKSAKFGLDTAMRIMLDEDVVADVAGSL